MNLNILLRGQSNAVLLGQQTNSAGVQPIVAEVQRLLGFDGVNDTVTLLFSSGDPSGHDTAVGGTSLLSDWLKPVNGNWQQGWTVNTLEQGLLDYIGSNVPADRKDDPTVVVWLHNEYDGAKASLTAAEWESAVRYDAALVRQAFGQTSIPYLFISPIPYGAGTDSGNQAIRAGMENLSADPSFQALVGAWTNDLNMDDTILGFPESHIGTTDGLLISGRTAQSLAELWAGYAKPGSPVALAGGALDNIGPVAVQATEVGTQQLSVTFGFDQASGFAPLDPDAAAGLGWSVHGSTTVVNATSLAITGPNTALITFSGDLPADGRLYYGYGIGKLAGADGNGQGNALYDNNGLPAHVTANGLPIGGGAVTPGLVVNGTGGADTLVAGANGDTVAGGAGSDYIIGGSGADTFVLAAGDGVDWIEGFTPGIDHLQFAAGIPAGSATTSLMTIEGVAGLAVTYTATGDIAFLANVSALAAGDLVFAGLAPVASALVPGTAGRDTLVAGTGGDTVVGGQGDDYLVAGTGADVFSFGTGDGHDWIDGFVPGTDDLQFNGLTAADISTAAWTIEGVPGLAVLYGSGGDFVFLARVTALPDLV